MLITRLARIEARVKILAKLTKPSKKKKLNNVAEANRLLCVISISANNFFSYRQMTLKQDPPRLASATALLSFALSRHRNSERQLFEMPQLCNLWLGHFSQNFHACFNPGQSSYQHLPLYEFFRTFLCLNSVNIFVVTPPPHPWFNVVDITCTDCLCSSTLYWGGVACERRRTSVRRLGEGVEERNESAPVRSFHPYPPPSCSGRAHICTAGWGGLTPGTFACSRPAFRLWKMKKIYIACKEEKILRETKGKSKIWGQWP